MATVKILSSDTTFNANEANTTYVMAADATIDTNGDGIAVGGDAKYRVLDINGSILSESNGIEVEMQHAPFGGATIHLGKSAVVDGNMNGIYANGQGHTFFNEGSVTGDNSGMTLYGTNSVINTGTIDGGSNGINLGQGVGDGMTVIKNSGTIYGFNNSIMGSSEYETVINTGTLDGDVDLKSGDDFFVLKKGVVNGEVMGGAGDDTFTTKKAGLQIVEDFGEGYDVVYSSVTFTLPANIEELYLTGRQDINATGSTGGNEIHGNAGRNTIDADGGFDFLDGGKGNDILTGGSSADDFHFARGTGKDVVTDYEAGLDEIQLGGLRGATDYADMVADHLTQKGEDLWITYGSDAIVLKGTTQAELKAGDFDFG